jgi:hypothetical protein
VVKDREGRKSCTVRGGETPNVETGGENDTNNEKKIETRVFLYS